MKKALIVFVVILSSLASIGCVNARTTAKGNEYVGQWVALNAQNYLVAIMDISATDPDYVIKELAFSGSVKASNPGKIIDGGKLQVGVMNYTYDKNSQEIIRSDGLRFRRSSPEELNQIREAFKHPTPDPNY